jgi:hypothetical protein
MVESHAGVSSRPQCSPLTFCRCAWVLASVDMRCSLAVNHSPTHNTRGGGQQSASDMPCAA